ncbi:ferredoxin [Streptomyces sp. MNU77]|uniref:2Fe-2S iron-sulfur cluster-binding protein n=1 Tax=Streptomyces sp. MNU77 TaxID=1573406 RepID=UPI0005E59C73|nr:2Fe-2S iron-sulfur cluster-binding protein [Streptomyces sp. MNU77]OLO25838.1 ferredoxin [Streptomyces sp. MNU77]
MPKVTYVSDTGEVRVIDGTAGDSVMQTAVRNGVPGIVGECGGVLSCATCHVFVDGADLGRLEPMNDLEDEMLDGTVVDRRPDSRLCCQITLSEELGDLRVTTPEAQE